MNDPCIGCPLFTVALEEYDRDLSQLVAAGRIPDWLLDPLITHVLQGADPCTFDDCSLLLTDCYQDH